MVWVETYIIFNLFYKNFLEHIFEADKGRTDKISQGCFSTHRLNQLIYLHVWVLDHVEEGKKENRAGGLTSSSKQVCQGPLEVGQSLRSIEAGVLILGALNLLQVDVNKIFGHRNLLFLIWKFKNTSSGKTDKIWAGKFEWLNFSGKIWAAYNVCWKIDQQKISNVKYGGLDWEG